MTIAENLERIRQQIAAACRKVNRDPDKVSLVCVTKGQELSRITEAIDLGCLDIGENKVKEASEKFNQITGVSWHMIGHLQSNKAKEAVRIFDLIHSVDSVKLATEINKQALKLNKIQDILLEVKTSPEATKFGFIPCETQEAALEIAKLSNLRIKGLMTIAPLVAHVQDARSYFAQLRQLRDRVNSNWLLSMGMSDDFEVAIEEGADIIRLGRAIFNV